MEVYTYAFLKTPKVELELPLGIGQSVQLVTGMQICAVVELDVDINRLQEDDALLVQAIVAHDRTLGELFQQQCLLPLRFGTLFRSLQALQEHLVTREAEYLANRGEAPHSMRSMSVGMRAEAMEWNGIASHS